MENKSGPVDIIKYKAIRAGENLENNPQFDTTLTARGRYRAFVGQTETQQSTSEYVGSGRAPIDIVPDLRDIEEKMRVKAILTGRVRESGLPPVS